jgi:hypothetical protein
MTTLGDSTRVRIANASDVEELFENCVRMQQENFLLPMDDDKVREVLLNATDPQIEKRRGVIGIIGQPGQMEASIGLMFEATWYSRALCIFDAWTYVVPEYRRTSNSHDLIAWAKTISDHFCYPLMIGILSNQRTEAKTRLVRRQLGEPKGAFFTYNANAGAL